MNGDFENQNGQNDNQENTQNNETNQKVKLRLRLKSGEEFEAEGSLNFVLAQKNDFLAQNTPNIAPITPQITRPPLFAAPDTKAAEIPNKPQINNIYETITPVQPDTENSTENAAENTSNTVPKITGQKNISISSRVVPDYNTQVPAIRWRQNQPQEAENKRLARHTSAPKNPWQIDEKIWFKIAYLDGADLVLRRKVKDLKPNLAALITLAAAKMIGGITKMSALELSKSLRLSGYLKGDERLDRILAPEIKAGTLFFEGSKRKREYIISQTGTAKAYTAAEHFLLV